jgi:hypothetical protein
VVQRRDASQVLSLSPSLSNPVWIGSLGHVASLKYASSLPGGPSTASWVLQRPPTYRATAMEAGRWIRIYRGAVPVWQGVLQEPVPSSDGWQMAATGAGSIGNSYRAIFSSWTVSSVITSAQSRGLPWKLGTVPGSGLWLGDAQDSGSLTVTDFLNNVTVQGGFIWSVDERDLTLSIFALPTTVNRLLISSSPVPRTIAEDVNSVWLRYEATADNSTTDSAATYGLANATNATDIALHGTTEEYYDLSSNGVMSSGTAAANGANILKRYQAITFSAPFQVGPGQLLNAGGAPVDLGTETAGNVYRLMLTDWVYTSGSGWPVTLIGGGVEFDDATQSLQVTALQTVQQDFQSLLAASFPTSSTPG